MSSGPESSGVHRLVPALEISWGGPQAAVPDRRRLGAGDPVSRRRPPIEAVMPTGSNSRSRANAHERAADEALIATARRT